MHLPELGLEDGLGNKKNIGRLEQSFWSNLPAGQNKSSTMSSLEKEGLTEAFQGDTIQPVAAKN